MWELHFFCVAQGLLFYTHDKTTWFIRPLHVNIYYFVQTSEQIHYRLAVLDQTLFDWIINWSSLRGIVSIIKVLKEMLQFCHLSFLALQNSVACCCKTLKKRSNLILLLHHGTCQFNWIWFLLLFPSCYSLFSLLNNSTTSGRVVENTPMFDQKIKL